MQIIEHYTCSKTGDPARNEDMFWIGDHFCLVADGVTSKSNTQYNGKTGGRIAVECLVQCMEKLSGNEDARTVLNRMRDTIRQFMSQNGIPDSLDPQASVLIYSYARRELWSVGDCPFMIDGRRYRNEKKIDALYSALRAVTIETLLMDGYSQEQLLQHDLARDMILPFLKRQSRLIDSDSEYSYSVVDGTHPIHHLTVIPVPKGSELILATDGYPVLRETLAQSEAALTQILAEDPLCFRITPSTKGISPGNQSFDDRTYVRIIT